MFRGYMCIFEWLKAQRAFCLRELEFKSCFIHVYQEEWLTSYSSQFLICKRGYSGLTRAPIHLYATLFTQNEHSIEAGDYYWISKKAE